MTGLTPIPLKTLVTRLFRELDRDGAIYDLPARRFVLGERDRDLSLTIHGRRAATPFGPAAGPHTQLAQNIVLGWLVGARIIELKTVQVKDDLAIPRPCIDMATIGYNVEWSQELRLAQSLEEYVKAAMLIAVIKASGVLDLAPGFGDTVFDMSVGYDLAGVKSDAVQAFINGLKDASPIIDRLRRELPKPYADLDFDTCVSDTLTLSTFHGCPPGEIEAIADFLMKENGLSVVVKLNPTLVGRQGMKELLHDTLGYTELTVPDDAFDKDANWDQAMGICGRLAATAQAEDRGFGVKFSNTLIVDNHRTFFPAAERQMYMSGAPLHVLAMQLVRRFRGVFGDRLPVSFSAGIDNRNFPSAVALGLAPVTVCSDLLKPGGYSRAQRFFQDLTKAMAAVDAHDLDTFTLRAFGHADAAKGDVSAARLLNTETYAEAVLNDARYRRAATNTPPRRVGSALALFDCLSCDKCVPVCPNDANFAFTMPAQEVEVVHLTRGADGGWTALPVQPVSLAKPHQIGNIADLCNECGNCDVFCPEDGGPYRIKPRFFLDADTWQRQSARDGLFIDGPLTLARIAGALYRLQESDGTVRFSGPGFDVAFAETDPAGTLDGTVAGDTLDLTWWRLLSALRQGVLADERANWINAAATAAQPGPASR